MDERNKEAITVHKVERFATWIYRSKGCRFRKQGHCIMCDYGASKNISIFDAIYETRRLVDLYRGKLDVVCIGSYGSIFDESEISRLKLRLICRELNRSDFGTIAFETHYTTVSNEVLDSIKRWLPGKDIIIEMGLESCNEMSLAAINKPINLPGLSHAIDRIQKRGLKVSLNVLLGIPGLSEKDQIKDCILSVKWAFFHCADEVTIFPMNVKPFTKLDEMRRHHKYEVPSLWALVEVLNALSDDEIARVSLSWFGDRQFQGICTNIIPPHTCDQCRLDLIDFCKEWSRYNSIKDSGSNRRRLLKVINNRHVCGCHDRIRKLMEEEP